MLHDILVTVILLFYGDILWPDFEIDLFQYDLRNQTAPFLDMHQHQKGMVNQIIA